jgi:serine/threonine-protein kinase
MDSASAALLDDGRPPGLVAGRYVLGEAFASGGTGMVHLGRIVGAGGFSRVVAIKRLFAQVARDRAFREMLLEEGRLVSRIRHPNVVPALDVIEEQNDVYIVMEYVHGPSLAQLLNRAREAGEPIPIEIATGILEGVLFGLHAAHEARGEEGTSLGIVHRDVSPQNMLVGADGVTRLIDFGIAKAATRMQVTDPGVVKGKMGYMAPEQFLYQPVSRHSDVYASSVVLWEALTGRRLFEGRSKQLSGESGAGSVRRAIETKVLPPSSLRSGIGEELDAVVLRGLEFEPADRFATAEAMALALRRAHAVASPVEVARWLERFAPDELELAEERIRLFEQAPYSASTEGVPTPTAQVDWSAATNLEHTRGGRARWIGVAAMALGTAALAIAIGARTRSFGASAVSVQSAGPSLDPSSVLVAGPTPPARPEEPDPAQRAELTGATPAATQAPSPSPRRAPRKSTKSSCDPPYTIDANGHKHYHPNCF